MAGPKRSRDSKSKVAKEETLEECKERFVETLDRVGETARFCTTGAADFVPPGLVVEGFGEVSLPLRASDAPRLIALADQAPYGRGEETILDTKVRRVWQIGAERLSFKNPRWDGFLEAIVGDVQRELGLSSKIRCQLYKFLIYDKGSFFVPHRDTEKEDGMFGTLVIGLPSAHEGGALVVAHDGKKIVCDFSKPEDLYRLPYAAFYADCQHEIKPVTSGYRVTLVYNLSLPEKKAQPHAPECRHEAKALAALLPRLFEDPRRNKLVIPLKHQYTEAGLHPTALKGPDQARLEVLSRAASLAGYQAFLALWIIYESGSVDEGSLYNSYKGRSPFRSRWEKGEDEGDDPEADGAEFVEVVDGSSTLQGWFSPEGEAVPFGIVEVFEEDLIAGEDREAYAKTQRIEEASGNAGVSMERWYRQGVVAIWPLNRFFQIMAFEGPTTSVPALGYLLRSPLTPELLEVAQNFASVILDHWTFRWRETGKEVSTTKAMLEHLSRLEDFELVERFLREDFPRYHTGSEGSALRSIGEAFGWKHLAPALSGAMAAVERDFREADLSKMILNLEEMSSGPSLVSPECTEAALAGAEGLLTSIKTWARPLRPDQWFASPWNPALVFPAFFRLVYRLQGLPLLSRFVEAALAEPESYPLREALLSAFFALETYAAKGDPCFPAYQRLGEHCASELQRLTREPIPPPADWTQTTKLSCKCKECAALKKFLLDPKESVYSYKAIQEARKHLEDTIERSDCDLDLETLRKGSPHTLVCTKNRKTYKALCRQYDEDLRSLAKVQQLLDAA